MQRLSGLDASFLYVETPTMHMHVALIAVLDPRDAEGGYAFSEVHARIEHEAHRRPELRRRLVEVPFGIDHPLWVDDPHFDAIHHIRRVGCPAPHGMAQLADLAARILSTPLDRSRPLWEVWLVEGLAEGRFALVAKVHHAIADGMTGASLLASMFSVSAEAPALARHQPRGSRRASVGDPRGDAGRQRGAQAVRRRHGQQLGRAHVTEPVQHGGAALHQVSALGAPSPAL